jgi:hypothetical protein
MGEYTHRDNMERDEKRRFKMIMGGGSKEMS